MAMHDLLLDDTTNVADIPEFADRKTTKVVDGKSTTGYFISDFTYAELKSLRLKQRLSYRTKLFDGVFSIPSLDDIMNLAKTSYNTTGRTVGLYIELKHPSFFKSIGFAMEDMFLAALVNGGYQVYGNSVPNHVQTDVVPIVIQCFEAPTLQYFKTVTTLPLVQLLNVQPKSKWTKENVEKIASYAQGIGPDKTTLGSLSYAQAREYVDEIKAYHLVLHPWTFRADNGIETKFHNDFNLELTYFYCCLGKGKNIPHGVLLY
jgi:glycerophosphoryl diester phosphodiesterase